MNRKWMKALILLALLLALVPFGACDDSEDKDNAISQGIIDKDIDSTVSQRIISLAPSNTEILFALGLGDKVIGDTDYCNYPPEAKPKTKVGGFATVDLEKVISLSPDLVLAANIHKETIAPELERRGVNVVMLDPKTVEEVLDEILLVGSLTGAEERASQLVAEMRSRFQAVTDKVSALSEDEKPRFLAIAWHDPIYASSTKSLQGQLIAMAGGINIAYDIGSEPIGLEAVIERNPEVIIAYTGHGEAMQEPFNWAKNEPRLKGTGALKSGRVYLLDADIIGRGGPRLVEALEQVAQLLHPELFGSPANEAQP
ncbi:MAG: cobalamin-binding protein [Dehalococcoidia bacterium]|nr:cobalamin-binding protein [Dehalococcoidia bacterium]